MGQRNPQGTIGEWLTGALQLFQILLHRFRGRLKKTPQFRNDVNFPFGTQILFLWRGGRTEKTLFRRWRIFWLRAIRDLPEQFRQKRIKLANLKGLILSADFHHTVFSMVASRR